MVDVLESLWRAIEPYAPTLFMLLGVFLIVMTPPFGRGAWRARRDPWRGFRFASRRRVFERAGGRCEAATFLVWSRCLGEATDADHVFPWSRGGATIVSNGQALCREHNRRKSSVAPPWWYVLGLEQRRRTYISTDSDYRVHWQMSDEDRELRSRNAASRNTPRF